MAKKLILLGIILMFASIATAETVYNPLTKGYADTLYCPINGICNLTIANVKNITVTDYAVIGSLNVSGNVTASNYFGWHNFSWIQNWQGIIPTIDSLNANMTGVLKNGTANNAFLSRLAIGATTNPYRLLINETVSDATVLYINSPTSSSNEAFAVRAKASTGMSSGKAFSVTDGSTWSRGMFYSNGMYCLGSGSIDRDTCFSRTDVNILQIHNGSNTGGSLNVTKHLYVGGNITGDINFSNVKNWQDTLATNANLTSIRNENTYLSYGIENEMISIITTPPWSYTAINSGAITFSSAYSNKDHPGTIVFRPSAIVNNSGYGLGTSTTILLQGNETSEMIGGMYTIPGGNITTTVFGFFDTPSSITDPTNAVMFECSNYTCWGETQQYNNQSITTTNYTINPLTWYRFKINIINISLVNFTITDSPYTTLLWSDVITNSSTIPTSSTRVTGHGVKQFWNLNTTSAINGLILDYINFKINRVLQR